MIELFNLAVARDRVAIPATAANPMESVSIAQLPAGNGVTLHFGHGDPGRPANQEGQTWELDPPLADGLFLSNTLGAGTLILEIHFRTYQAPTPVIDVSRARAPGTAPAKFVDQLLRNFGLK